MDDRLSDWMVDHEWSNVHDWLETTKGWTTFEEWLFSDDLYDTRKAIFDLFIMDTGKALDMEGESKIFNEDFVPWLWDGKQDSQRDALVELFLSKESKERRAFEQWAVEKWSDRQDE